MLRLKMAAERCYLSKEAKMSSKTVAVDEFQAQTAKYLEQASSAPVFITNGGKTVSVLLGIKQFEQLQAGDDFAGRELPEEAMIALDGKKDDD